MQMIRKELRNTLESYLLAAFVEDYSITPRTDMPYWVGINSATHVPPGTTRVGDTNGTPYPFDPLKT